MQDSAQHGCLLSCSNIFAVYIVYHGAGFWRTQECIWYTKGSCLVLLKSVINADVYWSASNALNFVLTALATASILQPPVFSNHACCLVVGPSSKVLPSLSPKWISVELVNLITCLIKHLWIVSAISSSATWFALALYYSSQVVCVWICLGRCQQMQWKRCHRR